MDKFLLRRPSESNMRLPQMPHALLEVGMFVTLLPVLRISDIRAKRYFDLHTFPTRDKAWISIGDNN